MPAKALTQGLSASRAKIKWRLLGHLGAIATTILSMACVAATPRIRSNKSVEPQSHLFNGRIPDVEKIVLENGMRVLVLPRRGAPTVSFVMQYGIGGVHERPGETGVAHLLEHMLFKGSETIGTTDVMAERALFKTIDELHEDMVAANASGSLVEAGRLKDQIDRLEDEAREFVVANEFDRILSRAGAQGLNATTTSESTTYFVELPSNRAELFFALEADRMANPVFREFYSERDVVMEERRMRVDASPRGTLYERHLSTAYSVHPYGQPVVGLMADLESLGRRDVERYYQNYYGPNNAVLAVVGNVETDQIANWARLYLGSIPERLDPPPVELREPEQIKERRIIIEWDAEPALRIGWHVPEATHNDAAAIAMLSVILTGGRTSRLHRHLVTDEQIAASVFSSTGPGSRFPQLFQIDVTPVHTASIDAVEASIYKEIQRIQDEGPTDEEIARVRNQVEAGRVRRLQSNLGLAFQITDAESLFGDWTTTFKSAELMTTVVSEDVRRAARRYLTSENRTVAVLQRSGVSR